jgi:glycosyltransferase involved in cell wall biosynthesis
MEHQAFVSFIIPAKNEEKMIGACLDAIRNLNYDPDFYEFILVDNDSADNTSTIARAKGAKVFTLPDVTISALRNLGAKNAQGSCLAFIDADCVIDENWLRNALPHFEDPTVGCVGSHPDIPGDHTWVQTTWQLQTQRKRGTKEVDWLPSMNILVRREAFFDCGGFNESLATCEDVDFCYRLKRKYKVVMNSNIKSIHFGEAKTVGEFFRKERWRSQSNLKGLLSHGFYWREFPSLTLPVFCLFLLLSLPVTILYGILTGFYLPAVVCFGLILVPAALLSLRISLKAGNLACFDKLTFLYLVYLLARVAAMISVTPPERHKVHVSGCVEIGAPKGNVAGAEKGST